MENKAPITTLALAAVAFVAAAAFADVPTTTGTISKVTVYRGQALVTRTLEVDLPQGPSELVVRNLPDGIVPDSLYAQTPDNVKVLSVRYREKAVREDTREEVKQLDGQIEDVKHKIKYAERGHAHLQLQWQMFEKLKDFAVTAASSDISRGLLTFEPVEKLTSLIEKKGREYQQEILKLEDEIEQCRKDLELLQRRRAELTSGNSRTQREAVLFINKADKKRAAIEMSYLANGANWQQQYNLRAEPDESKVLIEYNAVVNQTSGEDWNAVALSLSTAEPTIVADPPVLEPMLVGLSQLVSVQTDEYKAFMDLENLRHQQRARKENIKRGIWANRDLNELAATNQAFFFRASRTEVEKFQQQLAEVARTEGVSVTYDLPGRLSLPSRSDQQLITIAAVTAQADFTLVAMPLLTDYVYLQAELTNASDTVLLPGDAAMFRTGRFVGKGQLPQVTTGERFTAGFGIDSQVQVAHELEEKQTRIQGGNRIDTYNYRIALSNYKNTDAKLRLLDRLPYSDNDSIKIELTKTEPELSKDAEYMRTGRKKGILRWDLDLKPGTTDENATIVKYAYTMEYDRNMQIQPRQSQR